MKSTNNNRCRKKDWKKPCILILKTDSTNGSSEVPGNDGTPGAGQIS
jgi:hypothetical protein